MNRKAALVLSSKLLPWAPEARSGWGAPGASINHDQLSHPEGREPRAQMWARPPDLPGRSPGDRAADRCEDGAWFWRSVGRGQRWKEARTVRVPEGTRCYKKFITRINIYNSGTLKLGDAWHGGGCWDTVGQRGIHSSRLWVGPGNDQVPKSCTRRSCSWSPRQACLPTCCPPACPDVFKIPDVPPSGWGVENHSEWGHQ